MSENQQYLEKKDLENLRRTLREHLENAIHEEIQAQISAHARSWKIKEDSIFSTVETLQNSINLMQKEFNFKIGGLKSRHNREENAGFVTDDINRAVEFANKIRGELGLSAVPPPKSDDDIRMSGRGNRIKAPDR